MDSLASGSQIDPFGPKLSVHARGFQGNPQRHNWGHPLLSLSMGPPRGCQGALNACAHTCMCAGTQHTEAMHTNLCAHVYMCACMNTACVCMLVCVCLCVYNHVC